MGINPLTVVGGGTGGHVFPALSLVQTLRCRGYKAVLVSDQRGLTFTAVQQDPFKKILTFRRKPLVLFAWSQARALFTCILWFVKQRPPLIVSFGGYVSLPVLLAARILRIPFIIHEQNAVLGRVHRLCFRRARKLVTCFAHVKFVPAHFPTLKVGNPVRPEIVALRNKTYTPPLGDDPIVLFVLGGSQGAKIFSNIVPAALKGLDSHLLSRLHVIQQCRPEFLEETRKAYEAIGVRAELQPFFEAIEHVYEKAHLVIARSGASTCAELMVIGRPALLVPYPYAADDHQRANAAQLEKNGGVWMMIEKDFTPDKLRVFLQALLKTPHLLAERAARMAELGQPSANQDLAHQVETILGLDKDLSLKNPQKVRA